MERKIIMTVIAEDLEKTIDSILENMEKRVFPMQTEILPKDSVNETLIFSILELCKTILSRHIDYHTKGKILIQEDYETLRNHFQTQKNLIAVEIQEILRVLYNKDTKLDRVEKLGKIIAGNGYFEKIYVSAINEINRKNSTEEFDNYLYHTEFSAYNDWLEKNSLQGGSFPITYSIYHDLSYDSYFHIASMEEEEKRVNAQNMTPERFANAKKLPEDITLITACLRKKYLKKLSTVQLQKEYETLEHTLIHCLSMRNRLYVRNLKSREYPKEEIEKYWDAMKCLEMEKQRRAQKLLKSRYIKLK